MEINAPDESVDLEGLDIVQFLHSILDLALVGLDVNDEYESVVLLDLLHSGFGVQRSAGRQSSSSVHHRQPKTIQRTHEMMVLNWSILGT